MSAEPAADLPPPPKLDQRSQRRAVWGVVLGALGILGFFPFGPVLGPIALSLGIRARREMDETSASRAAATWAVVLGAIATVAGVLFFAAAAACDCM
jgi:hypothetical protein